MPDPTLPFPVTDAVRPAFGAGRTDLVNKKPMACIPAG